MPRFVPPEAARFYVQPNGLPVVVLTVDAEDVAAIDAPALAADTPPPGSALDGWSVLSRPTMTVVDGPGDLGFMVGPSHEPAAVEQTARWADAALRVAGAFVVFSPPAANGAPVANAAPGARGGFVRLVD